MQALRIAVAAIFCVATTFYALVWMADQWRTAVHPVEIGFNKARDTLFDEDSNSIRVYDVAAGSPAEQVGLRPGDEIIGLNGHVLTSYSLFDKVWTRSRPGDAVDITVRRAGSTEPITMHVTFRASRSNMPPEGVARTSVREVLRFFPIFFVIVGFGVLFLRLDDGHAWLLALLFAGFITVPNFVSRAAMPEWLQAFTSVYRTVFDSLITVMFYIFFALFPEKSPLEKRAPWLKWLALAVGAFMLFPGFPYGEAHLPAFVGRAIGQNGSEYSRQALTYGLLLLGLISLVGNCISREASPEARRKSRVLLAGTLVGVLPYVVGHMLMDFFGVSPKVLDRPDSEFIGTALSAVLCLFHRQTPGAGNSGTASTKRAVCAGTARIFCAAFLCRYAGHLSIHAGLFRIFCGEFAIRNGAERCVWRGTSVGFRPAGEARNRSHRSGIFSTIV